MAGGIKRESASPGVTRWVRVVLPYAVFGVKVHDDGSRAYVVETAGISHWMLGREWPDIAAWIDRKGGTWEVLPIWVL
jgi:hypothetical protein